MKEIKYIFRQWHIIVFALIVIMICSLVLGGDLEGAEPALLSWKGIKFLTYLIFFTSVSGLFVFIFLKIIASDYKKEIRIKLPFKKDKSDFGPNDPMWEDFQEFLKERDR